jgi:hypothetical protein
MCHYNETRPHSRRRLNYAAAWRESTPAKITAQPVRDPGVSLHSVAALDLNVGDLYRTTLLENPAYAAGADNNFKGGAPCVDSEASEYR